MSNTNSQDKPSGFFNTYAGITIKHCALVLLGGAAATFTAHYSKPATTSETDQDAVTVVCKSPVDKTNFLQAIVDAKQLGKDIPVKDLKNCNFSFIPKPR